jgi:hypothetical protein
MGKVKYGKDGVIESGTSKTKCTPPTKRYTKSIDAVVKGSIDSLLKFPKGNLEVGVKNTVTRLSDYSSEGLDIDLILFRVCEMANNRGLSASQTETLMRRAIDAWGQNKATSSINVTNNGVNNGLMAGVVVIPEDKKVPLSQNYSITLYNGPDLPDQYKGKIVYEIKPRQGAWYTPFIGYPLNEDSIVNGQLVAKSLILFNHSEGVTDLTTEGKTTTYKFHYGSSTEPANPSNGYLFVCDRMPSSIYFGEWTDDRKYLMKLL